MSNSLAHLGLGSQVQEDDTDRLGGYQTLDTDVYRAEITMAYLGKSQGGAASITFLYKAGGMDMSETIYVTDKKGSPTYHRDGKDYPLPGWTMANAICALATGKGIADQVTETRSVNVYNSTAGREVPTPSECLINLMGAKVAFGIQRVSENKSKKDGTNPDGSAKYVRTAEVRTFNKIAVAANAQGFTHNETKNTACTEPVFLAKWQEKNRGVDVDKTKKDVAPATATPATSAIDFTETSNSTPASSSQTEPQQQTSSTQLNFS